MGHAGIAATPGHGMAAIIPCIVQVNGIPGIIISITKNSMAIKLEEDRPAVIYFIFVLFKCESQGISVKAIDIL